MAVIAFSKPVSFPIAPLREMLTKHLPLYRWQIGEDDTGDPKQMGVFSETGVISGRSNATVIFTEYRATLGQFPGAPPHEWYLEVFAPTTELKPIADRITTIVCAVLMILDEHAAHCQLVQGGTWLRADEMPRLLRAVTGGEDLSVAAAFGVPHDTRPRTMIPAFSAPKADRNDHDGRVLAPMLFLHERHLSPHWAQIAEFARELDPEGEWSHTAAQGADILAGRGVHVLAIRHDGPVPSGLLDDALTRSFWHQGGRGTLGHRMHVSIGTVLDTSKADYVTVRQVAKVISLVVGMLAKLPGAVAVLNTDVGAIYDAEMAAGFLGPLASDEIPVQLWTWTRPHSLEDGNICLSTSGLTPFLGHELETWNAPLSRDEALEQVSDLIRYLLNNGPVIGHGDTAGRTKGDKAIRCFLGDSRTERGTPTRALVLEFGDPAEKAGVAPRADLPPGPQDAARIADEMIDGALGAIVGKDGGAFGGMLQSILDDRRAGRVPQPSPPPAAPPPVRPTSATFGRKVGGFGRKGL